MPPQAFDMSDDIPSTRASTLRPARWTRSCPACAASSANNPGPFTFKGTVSYIVGRGQVAIIDPGPLDEAHIAALLDAVRGETVTHIFVTHTHRDHSPAVPRDQGRDRRPGAGRGAAPGRAAAQCRRGAAPRRQQRHRFPARSRARRRRGRHRRGLDHRGGRRRPATPPTTWRSRFKEANLLFSGDHVMAWSTPVVAPPDGAMSDYMASLQKLARRSEAIYLPGHGGAVREAPRFVQHYIRHRRRARPRSCIGSAKGEADIPTIVRAIYIGLDPRLTEGGGPFGARPSRGSGRARGGARPTAQPSIEGRLPPESLTFWCPSCSASPFFAAVPASAAAPASGRAIASSISFIRLRTRAALVPKSNEP